MTIIIISMLLVISHATYIRFIATEPEHIRWPSSNEQVSNFAKFTMVDDSHLAIDPSMLCDSVVTASDSNTSWPNALNESRPYVLMVSLNLSTSADIEIAPNTEVVFENLTWAHNSTSVNIWHDWDRATVHISNTIINNTIIFVIYLRNVHPEQMILGNVSWDVGYDFSYSFYSLVSGLPFLSESFTSIDPSHHDFNFTSEILLSCGPAILNPFTEYERMVFAYYYPWYCLLDGPYEMLGHWYPEMVHHPKIGLYDSSNETVIRWQIEAAKAVGIDGFMVSCLPSWDVSTENLERLFRVADQMNFKIVYFFETIEAWPDMKEDVKSFLTNIFEKFSDEPAWLRIDGRPVITFYTAWRYTPTEWTEIFQYVKDQGYEGFYIAGDAGIYSITSFDGYNHYGFGPPEYALQSYPEESLFVHMKHAPKLWSADVLAENISIDYNRDTFSKGEYYNHSWEAALISEPDWITITSWNEWGEYTEIEPSVELGSRWFDITKYYSAQFKQSILPSYEPKVLFEINSLSESVNLGQSIRANVTIKNEGNGSLFWSTFSFVESPFAIDYNLSLERIPLLLPHESVNVIIDVILGDYDEGGIGHLDVTFMNWKLDLTTASSPNIILDFGSSNSINTIITSLILLAISGSVVCVVIFKVMVNSKRVKTLT
jgi:hypothetical protein